MKFQLFVPQRRRRSKKTGVVTTRESGLELSEYAVGAGLIAIAVVVAFTNVGRKITKGLEGLSPTSVVESGRATHLAEAEGCTPTVQRFECPADGCAGGDVAIVKVACADGRRATFHIPKEGGVKAAAGLAWASPTPSTTTKRE